MAISSTEKDAALAASRAELAQLQLEMEALRSSSQAVEVPLPGATAHLLTYSPTHLLTYSPTHLLTYSLTHLLTYSRTHLPTYSPVHCFTGQKEEGGDRHDHAQAGCRAARQAADHDEGALPQGVLAHIVGGVASHQQTANV